MTTNALFSSISGLILIFWHQQLSNLFGVKDPTVFWIVGSTLIYFAGTIGYEIRKQRKWAIIWIIIQVYAWLL